MKKEHWVLPRHRVVRNLAYWVMYPYMRCKLGVRIEKFKEQGDRPYLVVMNHQTVYDQFILGCAFKGPVYYIATEDIFSMGWVSKLIRWLVNPIPIKKQTNDLKAVKDCIRVAREGGTIALAPEGNRTYGGELCYIKPSIVKLMRVLKLPLAIFRIEGGYGVQPRWADDVRKGKMCGRVSRVVEPEEYAALSDEEMLELIRQELNVKEAAVNGTFRHRNLAQYLERVIYTCPQCGLAPHRSERDLLSCTVCGRQVRYLPTRELAAVGYTLPFRFMADWYNYQQDFVRRLPLDGWLEQPAFRDTAAVYEVHLYHKKQLLKKEVSLELYSNRMVAGEQVFPFAEASAVTVLGRNKLNVYAEGRVWQFKGGKRFNALKYVNFYHHYRNGNGGTDDGEFLGL